jgi:hypothetical protein
MALQMKTVEDLQQYFKGVIARSDHHAPGVSDVIYPILGMIIEHLDSGTNIEVREQNGTPANLLWATIHGTKYTFRYDHLKDSIEIRKDKLNGPLLHSIDNTKTISDLDRIFKSL